MIYIKSNISKDELAEKHWKWLSGIIKYNEIKYKSIEECKVVLEDPQKKENEKKACALKVVLGESLYLRLEEIIKGSLDELKRIKEEYPDYFLDENIIKFRKNQLDVIAEEIFNQKNKGTSFSEYDEELLENLENKYKEEKKSYAEFKKQLQEQLNLKTLITYKDKDNNDVSVDLIKLLHYDSLHNKNKTWNANILCESLGVSVCPYCNRQYIFVAGRKEIGWISSAQLDHFLPKDTNPLFSCSIFNLIPSCYCCNHGKSDDTRETIYPYAQEFGDNGKFIVKFPDEKLSNDIDFQKDIEIEIDVKSCRESTLIKNSISVFHLNELYNMHQLELKDFIKRFNCCKECRRKDYKNIDLKIGRWDNIRKRELILGLPLDAGDNEYPLKKMKYDILDQLEEIEGIKL